MKKHKLSGAWMVNKEKATKYDFKAEAELHKNDFKFNDGWDIVRCN